MDEKMKSKWETDSFIYGKDYLYDGISWRQRNFMCNFCKKEYKSAQALGGHMNVHRRDRARLRLSSPSLDHPNPNPNPNSDLLSSPPSSLQCLHYKTIHFPLLSLSTPSPTLSNEKKQEIFPFVPHSAQCSLGDMRKNTSIEGSSVANVNNGGFNGNAIDQENGSRFSKNRESMEMDLLKDGKMEMGLDLELRLRRSA